jgi:hypothetical protein
MVESRCQGTGHLREETQIQGAGVLHPIASCDLYADRIWLLTNRQFESRTEWVATLLVVPTSPDILPEREVVNICARLEYQDTYEQ